MPSDPERPGDREPRRGREHDRPREREERDSHVREWRRWIRRREG